VTERKGGGWRCRRRKGGGWPRQRGRGEAGRSGEAREESPGHGDGEESPGHGDGEESASRAVVACSCGRRVDAWMDKVLVDKVGSALMGLSVK
jgi:hypothetical protein